MLGGDPTADRFKARMICQDVTPKHGIIEIEKDRESVHLRLDRATMAEIAAQAAALGAQLSSLSGILSMLT